MKAIVTVMLKDGVLDPQDKAIGHALNNLGFPQNPNHAFTSPRRFGR
jgi:phosphoribosylformylglycinamidine (FGAM) synthase PurS component